MPENKITITVVVNGQSTDVEANINAPLQTIIPKALAATGNTGQPPENWILSDADGNPLDIKTKIGEFGFSSETILFLNLRAGVAG